MASRAVDHAAYGRDPQPPGTRDLILDALRDLDGRRTTVRSAVEWVCAVVQHEQRKADPAPPR
jgi:hypothetical protein